MIITVTLNPAVDKTARLTCLQPGELNRLSDVQVDAGGKGINVSKMIAALGGKSLATGFIGSSGEAIAIALKKLNIKSDFVRVDGATRTNLKVIDGQGRLTELNEPGFEINAKDAVALERRLADHVNPGTIVILAGSLPRGVKFDYYARLIRLVHSKGGLAFLDADGEPFRAALEEKPDFIKPNQHELFEYFKVEGSTSLEYLAKLCLRITEKGISGMAMSMGARGAIFINGKNLLRAPGLQVDAQSTVGAGDSMMGAIAYAVDKGIPWEKTVSLAMAASAGAVTTEGTNPPGIELVNRLIEQVEIYPMETSYKKGKHNAD